MKSLFLGLLLLGGLGCTGIQPVGPLAHKMKPPAASPEMEPPEPVTISAPKPVPPAILIEPGEVTSDNANATVQKLTNEFEYDYKTLPPPSKTVEVSRIKGGNP